jgi:hypothetical protein
VPTEHDDDLTSSVDTRNDVETDDFPKTTDDFDALEQEQGQDLKGTDRDDHDDENVVGK